MVAVSTARVRICSSLRRVLARTVGLVPDTALSRILPAGQRPRNVGGSVAVAAPSTAIRLFIGPANSAGQGWQWARAMERNIPNVGAVAMRVVSTAEFGHPSDQAVPVGDYRWSHSWRRAQSHAVADGFTHVIIESARPLFSDVSDRVIDDVTRFRGRGIVTVLLFHGSDLRMPDRHARREEWSPYRGDLWSMTATLQEQAERSAKLIAQLGLPVFVSTPDLLLDAPDALWLPVVIDPVAWTAQRAPFAHGGAPVLAHAPSHATVKGSDLIDPVLRRLHDEGVIRYRRIEHVSADRMPDIYRDVDVVLDQFRLGDYGVAACEAMAAGRLVVGHISESARTTVMRLTGLEVPILEATPDTLEATIRAIAADPGSYRARAEAGVAFAAVVHNGSRSAEVLRPFLVGDR